MVTKNVFKRYELKYFLTKEQYENIIDTIKKYTKEDEYGVYTIQSLYYDTKTNLLIRRSIEKPVYKEKLRVRSYGIAKENSKVFVELKKKYKGIVFKRRIKTTNKNAIGYLSNHKKIQGSQIAGEIDYFKKLYGDLQPAMLLIYDRVAYFSNENKDLRITFDTNIRYRDYDLDLGKGLYGEHLVKPGIYLMEIKTENSMPLWLAHLLSENHIYKTSFSKYGTAYKTILQRKREEDRKIG